MKHIATILVLVLVAGLVGAGTVSPYESYSETIYAEWGTPIVDGRATSLTEYEGLQDYTAQSWTGWWHDGTPSLQNNINIYFANDDMYFYIYMDVGFDDTPIALTDGVIMAFDLNSDGEWDYATEPYLVYHANGTKDYVPVPVPIEMLRTQYSAYIWHGTSPNTNLSHQQWEFALPRASFLLPQTFKMVIFTFTTSGEWAYPTDPLIGADPTNSTLWATVHLASLPTAATNGITDEQSIYDYLQENPVLVFIMLAVIAAVIASIWMFIRPPKKVPQTPQYPYRPPPAPPQYKQYRKRG